MWAESLEAGQPSRLLGYPVYEDANVPAPAAGANAALFGDFGAGYIIVDVGSSRIMRA